MQNGEAREDKRKYLFSLLLVLSVATCGRSRMALKAGVVTTQATQRCQGPQKRQHCLLSVEPEQQWCLCSTDETTLLGASVLLALWVLVCLCQPGPEWHRGHGFSQHCSLSSKSNVEPITYTLTSLGQGLILSVDTDRDNCLSWLVVSVCGSDLKCDLYCCHCSLVVCCYRDSSTATSHKDTLTGLYTIASNLWPLH